MTIEDSEEDLCPVCDGECTCKTNALSASSSTSAPPTIKTKSQQILLVPSKLTSAPLVPKNTPPTLTQKPRLVVIPPKKTPPPIPKTPKPDYSRRILSCAADIVLDQDGNAWKSKSNNKKPGPREFAKMTHLPHSDLLKDAPVMKLVGTIWIVEPATPTPIMRKKSDILLKTALVKQQLLQIQPKPLLSLTKTHNISPTDLENQKMLLLSERLVKIKNPFFDSSSSDSDKGNNNSKQKQNGIAYSNDELSVSNNNNCIENKKTDIAKNNKSFSNSSTSSDNSSWDSDSESAVNLATSNYYIADDSDISDAELNRNHGYVKSPFKQYAAAATISNSTSSISSNVFEEYEESDPQTDDSSSEINSDSESEISIESFSDLDSSVAVNNDRLLKDRDSMEIDVIFAATAESDDLDATDSEMDMFVENALYGGWSTTSEEDVDEKDFTFDNDDDDGGGEEQRLNDAFDDANWMSDFRPASEFSDAFLDFGFKSQIGVDFADTGGKSESAVDFLDGLPQSTRNFFDSESAVVMGYDDVAAIEEQLAALSQGILLPSSVSSSSPPTKEKTYRAYEIAKVGPNGEIIKTTKQLTIPNKFKALPVSKKRVSSVGKKSTTAGKKSAANSAAVAENNTLTSGNSTFTSSPGSSSSALRRLKNLLMAAISNSGTPSSRGSSSGPNVLNALVNSLKSIGGGSIQSKNALNALFELKKTLSSKPAKGSNGEESGNAVTNIAALAVIAAAVAASSKVKQQTNLSGNKKEPSNQEAQVQKTLEEILTAIPTLQKQSSNSSSNSSTPTAKSDKKDMTLDDFLDTAALESLFDSNNKSNDDSDDKDGEVFSKWTRIPIGTFRQSRRPSLSKVSKKDFKKAFRHTKHSAPAITLPALLGDVGGGNQLEINSSNILGWKSFKSESNNNSGVELYVPVSPSAFSFYQSPRLVNEFSELRDMPPLSMSDIYDDIFNEGLEAQTGFKKWNAKRKQK
ncbi:hypothetical protein HK100_007034 [Physocladia obscura]|uniref:Uncharacterized protein n=1 Tax=Physocladia obscura TaxID=109957 RepID=A0AAD5SS09_9FUNG|nr:hypothetical protein HK100_007034 [Physocladia obscura]